jgi:hypothetical protein
METDLQSEVLTAHANDQVSSFCETFFAYCHLLFERSGRIPPTFAEYCRQQKNENVQTTALLRSAEGILNDAIEEYQRAFPIHAKLHDSTSSDEIEVLMAFRAIDSAATKIHSFLRNCLIGGCRPTLLFRDENSASLNEIVIYMVAGMESNRYIDVYTDPASLTMRYTDMRPRCVDLTTLVEVRMEMAPEYTVEERRMLYTFC